MKKLIALVLVLLFFSTAGVTAFADEGYASDYGAFVGDTIDDFLDEDARRTLDENGIDPQDENWVSALSAQGVFSFIISLCKGGIKKPFAAFLSISAIILIFSALTAFSSFGGTAAEIAATAAAAVIITTDIYSCVSAAAQAIRACSAFMIGFVPAFISLIAASGRTMTGAASGATLLFAANAVSSFASNGVLPLMGGYLSVSMASGISPVISKINPAAVLKKATLWVLSLVSTVFLGVLSMQTAVSAAADDVNIKTVKFVLGTSVPVAGGVLSEAVSTVSSSLSLLKSSVGIYAVAALAVIILPVIADIVLWRLCFTLCSVLGSLFGAEKISSLLRAVDSVLACIMGIALLCAALFIISLTVLLVASRSV